MKISTSDVTDVLGNANRWLEEFRAANDHLQAEVNRLTAEVARLKADAWCTTHDRPWAEMFWLERRENDCLHAEVKRLTEQLEWTKEHKRHLRAIVDFVHEHDRSLITTKGHRFP